jgi:hypothetical protein
MTKYKSKYIDRIRNIIFNEQPNIIGKPYKKMYNGQKINHITLDLGRNRYMSVPQSAYRRAVKKQEEKKWEPTAERQDVRYQHKNFNQYRFHGDFSLNQIREKVQGMSNKLAQEGKRGLISVAVRYLGNEKGAWRSGYMRRYGEQIDLSNLDGYGEELPDHYTGFAIYLLDQ